MHIFYTKLYSGKASCGNFGGINKALLQNRGKLEPVLCILSGGNLML